MRKHAAKIPSSTKLNADSERYKTLKRALAGVGPIRRGSLLRRSMPCGKEGCRCQAIPPTLHGPYYQWTRKVKGKTITLRVSRPEAKMLAQWIDNGRRLDRLLRNLERVSYRMTEKLMRGSRHRTRPLPTRGSTRS